MAMASLAVAVNIRFNVHVFDLIIWANYCLAVVFLNMLFFFILKGVRLDNVAMPWISWGYRGDIVGIIL